jgi:hypothetical protein
LRGFIAGFACGCKGPATILINADHGVADDGFARQMAERMRLVETVTHVIVAGEVVEQLATGIEEHGEAVGLHLHGRRPIRRARVEFRWEVYSLEEALRARQFFENDKPAAIELDGYDPEEHVDEKADETGLYSPAHGYIVKAGGTAYGPPDELIEWVAALREDDFIHVETIQLEYAGDGTE